MSAEVRISPAHLLATASLTASRPLPYSIGLLLLLRACGTLPLHDEPGASACARPDAHVDGFQHSTARRISVHRDGGISGACLPASQVCQQAWFQVCCTHCSRALAVELQAGVTDAQCASCSRTFTVRVPASFMPQQREPPPARRQPRQERKLSASLLAFNVFRKTEAVRLRRDQPQLSKLEVQRAIYVSWATAAANPSYDGASAPSPAPSSLRSPQPSPTPSVGPAATRAAPARPARARGGAQGRGRGGRAARARGRARGGRSMETDDERRVRTLGA